MVEPPDALELGLRLARALEAGSLPYALGGALAYGQYGIPRATHDVDLNVFVGVERLDETLQVLIAAGAQFDEPTARKEASERGLMIGHCDGMRIDVFVPSIEFSWEAHRTRVQLLIGDERFWFLSAEALCVFKLLFFRSKDIVDLERLVAVYLPLDVAYVRKQLTGMMGEDDPRTQTWDRLVREFGA